MLRSLPFHLSNSSGSILAEKMFIGTSTRTGPGWPDSARAKAFSIVSGNNSGVSTLQARFTNGSVDLVLGPVGVQVDFLVRVLAEVERWDVAGYHDHGDAVQRGVRHPGRRVGEARG